MPPKQFHVSASLNNRTAQQSCFDTSCVFSDFLPDSFLPGKILLIVGNNITSQLPLLLSFIAGKGDNSDRIDPFNKQINFISILKITQICLKFKNSMFSHKTVKSCRFQVEICSGRIEFLFFSITSGRICFMLSYRVRLFQLYFLYSQLVLSGWSMLCYDMQALPVNF